MKPSPRSDRPDFSALAREHLPKLAASVRRDLAQREALGDLPPGELNVDDVVDAVMRRAEDSLVRDPQQSVDDALRRLADDYLTTEVRRIQLSRARFVNLDDAAEAAVADEIVGLHDDIPDFHETDGDLDIEDVLPDLDVPATDVTAGSGELQSCVRNALADLPRVWRHVLELRFAERLAGPEIAERSGVPEADIPALIDHSRALLRARLEEIGCQFIH